MYSRSKISTDENCQSLGIYMETENYLISFISSFRLIVFIVRGNYLDY